MASFKFPKTNPESIRGMAYAIRNEISGGIAVDDNRFSIRQIEMEIRHTAALLQKQEDLANEALGILPSEARATPYPCIPMIDSKQFKCKCTKSGGRFKEASIPKMYDWRGHSLIYYVGNTDLDMEFVPLTSIFEINALGEDLNKPTYFILGQKIFVSLPKKYALMCEITVIGVPEDPTATSGKCFDVWNIAWNAPGHIKALTKERVMQTMGSTFLQTGQSRDIRNNGQAGNQVVTTQTA